MHVPVLQAPVLEGLAIVSDGIYIDCTFGRGGHSRALLGALGPEGRLLALDRDPQAGDAAAELVRTDARVDFARVRFDALEALVHDRGWMGMVSGIMFDLGVSSPQLDDAERGFSFRADGPLDMRMDTEAGAPVSAWLNQASPGEIAQVLSRFGEERHAQRISRAIVARRAEAPIVRTRELAEVIVDAYPARERRGRGSGSGRHPATKAFQALRVFINAELESLEAALPQALRCLAPGGRLAVITFHSLEDRIVKRFMRREHRAPGPTDLPIVGSPTGPLAVVHKPVRAGEDEVAGNPRARSATLRVAVKRVEGPAC